jgi:hypothetical protein
MADHQGVRAAVDFSARYVHIHFQPYFGEPVMKSQLAAPMAATLLLISSVPLIAGELPFNAPATQLAQERGQLLHRAAHALYESTPNASRISDLWLFPTADPDTVFAEYTLRSKGDAPTKHLAVLTLQGDRILRTHELTDVADATLDRQ